MYQRNSAKRSELGDVKNFELFGANEKKESPTVRARQAMGHENWCTPCYRKYIGPDMDPYIVVTLCREIANNDEKEKEEFKTVNLFTHYTKPKMQAGAHVLYTPELRNTIEMEIEPWKPEEKIFLKLVCWDKDRISADDLIGMCKADVTEAFQTGMKNFMFTLEFRGDGYPKDAGDVELNVYYDGATSRVKIELLALADVKLNKLDHIDKGSSSTAAVFAVSVLFIFLGISLCWYSWMEKWETWETLFFAFDLLTTVGYGGHRPFTHSGSLLFTTFLVLIGIAIVSISLSVLVTHMMDNMKRKTTALFQDTDKINLMEDLNEKGKVSRFSLCREVPKSCFMVLGLLLAGVFLTMNAKIIIPRGEELGRSLDFQEAVYFVVDTMTKTGFGDFSPSNGRWKIFGIVYISFSTVSIATMVKDLMELMASKRARDKRLTTLTNSFRSSDDFALFDENGDGEISEVEFLVKMLSRLKLCSDADVETIRATFRLLDKDGSGSVDCDELKEYWMNVVNDLHDSEKSPEKSPSK